MLNAVRESVILPPLPHDQAGRPVAPHRGHAADPAAAATEPRAAGRRSAARRLPAHLRPGQRAGTPLTGGRRCAIRCPTPSPAASSCCWKQADDDSCTLWMPPVPARSALGEVLRKYPACNFEALAPELLAQRISAAYAQGESNAAAVVSEVQGDADLTRMMQELPAVEDLLESAGDAPIIRMLNALLTQAARDGASDIHIEPYERTSSVRFRIDGTLREVVKPNRALHAALISRLKIMADLDIAEKRLPQDGRISLRIGTRAVDVRVSTLPSAHGERAVLRLLDKTESQAHAGSRGHAGRHAGALRAADRPAARHHPGDRPDRLGQDDHAVRRAEPARCQPQQHHDGGRPDRVRTARRRPDAGQRQDRPDLRQGVARHPAAGSGRDHDRRDPRLSRPRRSRSRPRSPATWCWPRCTPTIRSAP